MRADRLLSLMMLLQSRGKVTATDASRELGVSVRTVYRDIEALSMAGVPIYSESGPGGGFGLLDTYRTDLTGLNDGETKALFMLNIPSPLTQLGVAQDLKAALLKLSAALPAGRRADEDRIRQRVYVDSSWWFNGDESVPQLKALRDAVWTDRTIECRCDIMHRFAIRLKLDPLGLVAKGGIWHLVCRVNGKLRVYRISQLSDIEVTSETFERPEDFDLPGFWKDYCVQYERNQSLYPVKLRVNSSIVGSLSIYLGPRASSLRSLDTDEVRWTTVEVKFESLESARRMVLGLGSAVEVVEPGPLRDSVRDYAEQILQVYGSGSRPDC